MNGRRSSLALRTFAAIVFPRGRRRSRASCMSSPSIKITRLSVKAAKPSCVDPEYETKRPRVWLYLIKKPMFQHVASALQSTGDQPLRVIITCYKLYQTSTATKR